MPDVKNPLTHSEETVWVAFRDDQLEALTKGLSSAQYLLQFLPVDHPLAEVCRPHVELAQKVLFQGERVDFENEETIQ